MSRLGPLSSLRTISDRVSETCLASIEEWVCETSLTSSGKCMSETSLASIEKWLCETILTRTKKMCLRLVSLHLENGPVILISQEFKMGLRD